MRRASWPCLALISSFLFNNAAMAGGPKKADVGTCGPIPGVLLGSKGPQGWHSYQEKDSVRADTLLVALPEANIHSKNQAVLLVMIADVGKRGPLPVFESALKIHAADDVDLDITLDRGIAGFLNQKKKGAAKVRLRFLDQTWLLTLQQPGTMAGLEIYGRHAPGVPKFIAADGKLKAADAPTIDLFLLVRKGSVSLLAGDQEITLDAPPGAAKVHWDSVARNIDVQRLQELPPKLLPSTPDEQEHYKRICEFARRLGEGSIDKVLAKASESAVKLEHNGAAVCYGALDMLPQLMNVLATSRQAEARDMAIVVLRNWIGRGPGQVEKLYRELIQERKITPSQARTAIHLLYGFDDDEKRDPATYEVLIDCLNHSKLAVRELARWHLVRLVPDGKKIGYDAGAPPEQRERAYEQWRALVPAGQLPANIKARIDKR